MQEQRKKLLSALLEKPTIYHIDVVDGSMLPESMKDKKEVTFAIKPPSLATLASIAHLLQDLPKELMEGGKKLTIDKVMPHTDVMVQIICVIAHAQKSDYPEWHEPFFKSNCTPKDIFEIFQEVSLKMGSDFFLTSFQIAGQTNPMMMRRPKSSTLISL